MSSPYKYSSDEKGRTWGIIRSALTRACMIEREYTQGQISGSDLDARLDALAADATDEFWGTPRTTPAPVDATQRKAAFAASSTMAARSGHESPADDLCIHCGRGHTAHVRLGTPDEVPHVHSRLYCDTTRTQGFEAWWMR